MKWYLTNCSTVHITTSLSPLPSKQACSVVEAGYLTSTDTLFTFAYVVMKMQNTKMMAVNKVR